MPPVPMLVCLLAPERVDLLHALRAHFAGDRSVTVVVERRGDRADAPTGAGGADDRRMAAVARDLVRGLPAELRREARHLRFVQRLQPVTRTYEKLELAAVVERSRGGDPDAVSELLWRVKGRVTTGLRRQVAPGALDAAAAEVRGRMLDDLATRASAPWPLEPWVDGIVADVLAGPGRRQTIARRPGTRGRDATA